MLIISAILIVTTLQLGFSQDVPIVETPLGKVQGHYLVSSGGNKYKGFESIPFAEPPVNQSRFKDPEPVKPWKNVLIANKFPKPCVSYGPSLLPNGGYVHGVEDCLYLNVYVPANPTKKPLPVIFYIYGGAFEFASFYGTEQSYLIDHDIVFVSVNYRHTILGFLSTEDNIVSGNMGLKDQALALRWVSENIKYFGGDPKKVMITGVSAGGTSVHYHYLSPMTAGLFQTGISFSGTAFTCSSEAEDTRGKAIKLGKILGCPTDDTHKMIECLKGLPAYDIVAALSHFKTWKFADYTPFGPVVEKNSSNPFINRCPDEIIESGNTHPVPWITGVVSEDGLYPVAEFILNATVMEDLNKNWESLAPHLLNYYYLIPEDKHANVAQKIRKHYFGDKPINKETALILTHLVGDRNYFYDAVKAAKNQALTNPAPVRFYYYSYKATDSVSSVLSKNKENLGVCHADDVLMVLGNPIISPNKSSSDLAMHTELVKFWISVAVNKEPQLYPEWMKLDSANPVLKYLHMAGPGNFKLKINDDLGQSKFWDSIFELNPGNK